MSRSRFSLVVCLSLVVVLFAVSTLQAQGPQPRPEPVEGPKQPQAASLALDTAFTYQGQIKNGSVGVTGNCDFQFALYDALSLGARIGVTQTVSSLALANGLFTAPLDFGAGALTGDARFLNIQVRCPAGGGAYTALTPRQALTPAPMALALPGLWTQQNATSPNLIGGYSGNVISPTVVGGVIGGGGTAGAINRVTSGYAAIGGGQNNMAGGAYSVVGGGYFNTTSGMYSAIGGGAQNSAGGNYSTIGGGYSNTANLSSVVAGGTRNMASNAISTVGGGSDNTAGGYAGTVAGGSGNNASGDYSAAGGGSVNNATGKYSAIPGGYFNYATGDYSLAAGSYADTNGQAGAFVWGDTSSMNYFFSTAPNQFIVRAAGGAGINTNTPVAGGLTVNGQVVAGGVNAPAGGEPFTSEGSNSGLSLDDRDGGLNPRWVVYPQSGLLRLWNATNGDVVTVTVGGKLTANGGFSGGCLNNSSLPFNMNGGKSCNMDFAESFASAERTAPGDLVALVQRPETAGSAPAVRRTQRAHDDLLIGVVSQNPGLVFDNGQTRLAGDNSRLITADHTVVALVGRVLGNVSMENGPIAIGDPLTSAGRPGAAMKAMHAGKIVGYALEAAEHDGQILMLLQPGMYLPGAELATQSENAQLKAQVAQLDARLAALEAGGIANAPFNWGGLRELGLVMLLVLLVSRRR